MAGAGGSGPSRSVRSAASRAVRVPRPPNAWIIYRSDKIRELPPLAPGEQRRAQAEVSKIISAMWAKESDETRIEYEKRAETAKIEHALKYPGYRFKPLTKEEKRAQKKLERDQRLAQRRKGPKTGPNPDLSSPPPPPPPPPVPLPSASVPQYYTSTIVPINLSQFGHGSISPLPYPTTTSLEPTGPTPPVSTAASPADPSPSPAPSTSTNEIRSPSNMMNLHLSSVGQSKSMTPVTPSSTISTPTVSTPLFPTFNSPAFASGQEWISAPTFGFENHEMFVPAPTSSSLWEAYQQQEQFQPPRGQYMTTGGMLHDDLSFNIEPVHLTNVFVGVSMDPMLSTFGSCMNSVDIPQLSVDPDGTIDLNGAFPWACCDESEPGLNLALLKVDDPLPATVMENLRLMYSHGDASVVHGESYEGSALNVNCNPEDFFDFRAPMFSAERVMHFETQNLGSEERYVPPAGAGNSSMRRVGGLWTRDVMKTRPQ